MRGFTWRHCGKMRWAIAESRTVNVSLPAVERFTARATRLQEQGADKSRIEAYARRWVSWVQAGVRELLGASLQQLFGGPHGDRQRG